MLFLGGKQIFNLVQGGSVTLEFTFASEKQTGSEPLLLALPDRTRTREYASPQKVEGGKITLKFPERELKEEEIFGRKSIWISCRPDQGLRQAAMLSLSRIKISNVSGKAQPDIGFYNFSPVDLKDN